MIDSSSYAQNIAPVIAINDELYSNNNNIRSPVTMHRDEQNNSFPTIETSTVACCSHNDQLNGNFLCLSNNVINLNEIPISALRPKTRELLSKRLNAIKVILSENGSPRDWRGVLNSIGLSDVVNTVQSKPDEMKEVLDLWLKSREDIAFIGTLQNILGTIDRWDVVDDSNDYFVEDAKLYLDTLSKRKNSRSVDNQTRNVEMDQCPKFDESEFITHDDVARAKMGLPSQRYDAYLLFDYFDINFATEILTKMETEYGLKLCTKERDLIGGTIESDAIMRMISERCDRLIVIFSNAFFDSPANTFFVKFAQALGIEQRKRKIIPCMNEPCQLPPLFSFYFTLRYRETTQYFNFWTKLYQSIQNVPINRISSSTMPRITITEIDSPSTVPAIESQPKPQQAIIQNELNAPNSQRRKKEKSKSPKSSSPSTPTSLKKFWNNLPKIGSQSTISSSMWTLGVTDQMIFDKENERCQSSLSLNNNSTSSPTPTKYKKTKWFKNLLSPSSAYKLSAESDSSVGIDNTTKKKKWYRKRFRSRTKTEPTAASAN